MKALKTKSVSGLDFTKKSNDDSNSEFYEFEGIASTYDLPDRENDIIVKGAFENFKDANAVTVPLLYSHNAEKVLGKIELTDDGDKLLAKGFILKGNSLNDDIYKMIKSEALASLSIGFIVKSFEYRDEDDLFAGIIIKEAEIVETSVVAIPANESAKISSVKSLDDGAFQIIYNLGSGNVVCDELKDYKQQLLNKL